MPRVELVIYRDVDGTVPLLEWFDSLPPKVLDKCRVWLRRLHDQGHEMRRPEADYLRDGIHELRVGFRGINYRMLYFHAGQKLVVVSHGLIKERVVPPKEIDLAVQRQNLFRKNPVVHSYQEDESSG